MKTKKQSFIQGFKSIVFNQRGEIGIQGEAAPEVEPQEEISDQPEEIVEAEAETSEQIEEPNDETTSEIKAETEAELEEEIKEAIEDGASEEEVKNMIRQFTLKVDGKEFVKEVDLSDEDALKRELQLAHKGRQSMQELQELKNAYTENLQRLLEDPFAVLKELDENFDPLELSASYIDKLAKEQEMSPEEKAEIQRQREFEEIKAERDRLKKEAEDKKIELERKALAEEIQTDIMSALSEDDELVADRETVALVAENLMWAAKNNMHDITAKDVLPTVKEQLRKNFDKYASRFKSPAVLKKYMGNNLLEQLREERVQQAKNQIKSASNIKKDISKQEPVEEKREKIKLSDLFK